MDERRAARAAPTVEANTHAQPGRQATGPRQNSTTEERLAFFGGARR